MTDDRDPLDQQLRAVADAIDDASAPVTSDEAISVAGPAGPGGRKGRLIAAGAAVVLIVGAVAWSFGDDDDETSVVTPGPDSSHTDTSTTTVSTTTTLADLDWDSLPEMGIAVQPLAGPLRVYDLDGSELGDTPSLSGTVNGPRLAVWPGEVSEDSYAPAEVPAGCASAASGGGLRVALCGDPELPRRIDMVDSAGDATVLLDAPPTPDGSTAEVLGHWRWALPSPDGRWVLAQWSGECEVPIAFLIEVATGELRTVDGRAGAAWGSAVESKGLGWAPDGRAVVVLGEGLCGSGATEPGSYLLDPETVDLQLVVAAGEPSEQVFVWHARAHGNQLEWLVHSALRSLNLDGCCGEPSHGGSGVSSGAIYDGHEIGIGGHASDGSGTPPDASSHQRLPLLDGEAVVLAPGEKVFGQAVVGFTCGANRWWLSWWEQTRPEIDSMLLLAEELVPHLACTLGEPPDPG